MTTPRSLPVPWQRVSIRRRGSLLALLRQAGTSLPARIVSADRSALVVSVDERLATPPARTKVVVEWVDDEGIGRAAGRVGESEPSPLLEIELDRPLRLAQRRVHPRVAMSIEVSAWSLVDATRRLTGRTVDLSEGGALLELPGTPVAAVTLELRLALPDGPLRARGRIARRLEFDRVAVAFEQMAAGDLQRLAELVRSRRTDSMLACSR